MNRFDDVLKYDLAIFPSIFPNRAAVLNQIFIVNGNGCGWDADGNLVGSCTDEGRFNELVAIERYIGAGLHKQPSENHDLKYIPAELLERFLSFNIPPDIEERTTNINFTHWYPMYVGHSTLERMPDNVTPDWLNAAWECATLLVNTPLEAAELDKQIKWALHSFKGDEAKAREWAVREWQTNHDVAQAFLENLPGRFPNHKFEVNPAPMFNKDRAFDKDGITPWPLDESPYQGRDLLIEPFMKAIKFVYKMARKPKNKNKNIPYAGLPLGHDDRVGSFGPEIALKASNLEYQEYEQGRPPLDIILVSMAQICVEQGRRLAKQEMLKNLHTYFSHKHYEKEHQKWLADLQVKAQTDPKEAARLRIFERQEAKKASGENYPDILGCFDKNDPLETEIAKEMAESRKRMCADILTKLDAEEKR